MSKSEIRNYSLFLHYRTENHICILHNYYTNIYEHKQTAIHINTDLTTY